MAVCIGAEPSGSPGRGAGDSGPAAPLHGLRGLVGRPRGPELRGFGAPTAGSSRKKPKGGERGGGWVRAKSFFLVIVGGGGLFLQGTQKRVDSDQKGHGFCRLGFGFNGNPEKGLRM